MKKIIDFLTILFTLVFFTISINAHIKSESVLGCSCKKNEKKELIIFPRVMAVLGNVSKILLDRHNKSEVIKQVDDMVDNIVQLVQAAIKRTNPSTQFMASKLAILFLKEIKKNSSLLKILNSYVHCCSHNILSA